MPIETVNSLDDPRLAPYRDLQNAESARRAGLFIVEGQWLVQRLFDSDFEVASVLLEEGRFEQLANELPARSRIFVVPRELIRQIVGFDFHRGVIACGRRKPPAKLADVLTPHVQRLTIVVCVDVQDAVNLAGILRNCAAFGVDAVLLNDGCADWCSRRVLRVSMGAVFKLPVVQSVALADDLRALREHRDVQLVAAVLDDQAEPLEAASRPARLALLVGNEARGLSERWTSLCDRRVTLPMQWGTDSLNVAVASGVFLYHFTRQADDHPPRDTR